MAFREQFERFVSNLLALGPRRLALLAAIGLAVFALVGAAGYFLSRPTNEILYSGLDKEDVSRIGAALREASVNFDVSADGATVYVAFGDTAHARMLLAEQGLPRASGTGYELFDKVGSLGLTSFMQQITRVRALEGELARTIQTMRSVKAARVHLVMPDEGSFRRARTPPSASVVLRTEGADDARIAQAVRHLVAAAMPGMKVDQVTVLNVDGQLLASGEDGGDSGPGKMLTLEKSVSDEIRSNVRRTLAPYLSLRNFQISVAVRLNTDKKETTETTYDPDSKVERSVRTDKETSTSQNSTTQQPTSVGQNVPQPNASQGNGKQANEESNKKEELTNYEISSKTMSTVSNGFAIEHLSVAVLINRPGLAATLGDKATPAQIDKQVGEIEQLVSSAAGLRKDRGDVIKVAAVDFIDSGKEMEPVPPISLTEALMRQFGSIVSALAMLAVAFLVVWVGLRPATRALIDMREPLGAEGALALGGAGAAPAQLAGDLASGDPPMIGETPRGDQPLLEDWTPHRNRAPQKRLEQLIDFDEAQAAAILKQWIRHGERV
ncbi:flagellar M-ring protein FliF [Rhodoblastus acidophilus]|uniref:Flagellar M-ring protein n=1 Tax=Candidatus Rhodoblastus alkanivorans TaxID=2954117 RepID=A0ABS9Z3N3_9HYPH|nr:flagellar basal-body MS-ring/collar protein FliF [Candidatus Rhodoblastus alkanivorans]MCI4678834.1 flagellar M-ring protein FliF [Candidatus Rhodoblastus alkanivorans]MCI4682223.1 flagellar M-ring protein FliF [Candidatus Rhodoblastus alkanivorans]MDI4639525.1 flagellar M-ring protein FliF [Rhodoblastus acidophilus]